MLPHRPVLGLFALLTITLLVGLYLATFLQKVFFKKRKPFSHLGQAHYSKADGLDQTMPVVLNSLRTLPKQKYAESQNHHVFPPAFPVPPCKLSLFALSTILSYTASSHIIPSSSELHSSSFPFPLPFTSSFDHICTRVAK